MAHGNEAARTPPTTRKIPRTPVAAELAANLNAMDELLMSAFGPDDFAYVVLGHDGVIAASNAREGYLTPIVAGSPPPKPEGN